MSPSADRAMHPLAVAAPRFRLGDRLTHAFDEDGITLAWEAVQAAGLQPGDALAAEMDLPAWWWAGARLEHDPDAANRLHHDNTRHGPVACIVETDDPPDLEQQAAQALAKATKIDQETAQRWQKARQDDPWPSDQPLGAHVIQPRHEEVLAQRMRLGTMEVVSWTQVSPGAAPSEFIRLQHAVGAYHVVMVEGSQQRTVALWAGQDPPQVGQRASPRLRRLTRHQGVWRHGIKFAP